MTTNTRIWLGVSASVAALVFCWYLFHEEPAPASTTGTRAVAAPLAPPPAVAAASVEKWPVRGTAAFKRAALERGQKWLAARGRDAGSLIAMWDVTGDETILNEAAEKFPNDPRVCLAMIRQAENDAAKAMPWIERLIAAEPKNPEGFYLKAAALMNARDRAGALAALRTAATMGGPRDNHLRERVMTVREGALASGAGVGDAAYLALAAPLENSTIYTPVTSMAQALKQELAEAKAGGHDDRVLEVAGLGLGLAARFGDASAGVVVDAMVASSMERMILNQLSDDTEIGAEGKTVKQMKEEAALRSQQLGVYMKQQTSHPGLLENSTEAVMAEYTDRFLLHGEIAARAWLIQQAEAPKAP